MVLPFNGWSGAVTRNNFTFPYALWFDFKTINWLAAVRIYFNSLSSGVESELGDCCRSRWWWWLECRTIWLTAFLQNGVRVEFLCKQHMPAHTSLFLPSYAAWMNEWQPGPCLTDWLPVVLEPCVPNEVGHSLLSRTINIFALTPSKLEIQCRITRVSSLRTIKRFTVLVVELRCEDAVLENARSLDKTQQIIKK